MKLILTIALSGLALISSVVAAPAKRSTNEAALILEVKVALGNVKGRIDHLAVDLRRQLLFIAELDNDSVAVIDLKSRRLLRRLDQLHEPQGIGYEPTTDTLYVANAGDGSVVLFHGYALDRVGQIELGQDADNVRIDREARRVYVGYGNGALAVIDAASRQKLTVIPLKAHPESFQLVPPESTIVVNVPDAHEIAVIDRRTNQSITNWPTKDLSSNFPLALDETAQRVITVFRHPAKLAVMDAHSGALLSTVDTCGDSDDVFVDSQHHRLYVICGTGYIAVYAANADTYREIERIPTSAGARTGLLIPQRNELAVAVRATQSDGAAVWLYRTNP